MRRHLPAILVLTGAIAPGFPKADGETRVLTGPTGTVWDVVFSPDGSLVAAASDIEGSALAKRENPATPVAAVHVWDRRSGRLERTFPADSQLLSLAFTPDGRWLAAGGSGAVILWDLRSGEEVRRLEAGARSIVIPPVGKSLVALDASLRAQEVRIYELPAGTLTRTIAGEGERLSAMDASADGGTIAIGSHEAGFAGAVRIYDSRSGQLKRSIPEPADHIKALALSPDGRVLAYPVKFAIRLRDAATGKSERTVEKFVAKLEFSHDGETLIGLIPSGDSSTIHFIEAGTGKVKKSIKVPHQNLGQFAVSRDGRWLAVGSGSKGQGSVQLMQSGLAW